MTIVTIVMGFLTICSGVVLLQLSKSAKDVPDTAVFKGDLDQIREVGEQEAPEMEPKADAIRGAAAIIRRISVSRQKMEEEEAKRFFREKHEDQTSQVGENEVVEWDGIRRRKTVIGDRPTMTPRSNRSVKSPHPPLGMSRFPDEDDDDHKMPLRTPSRNNSIFSGVRSRASTILHHPLSWQQEADEDESRGSIHPVALADIAVNNKQGIDTTYHGSSGNGGLEPPFDLQAGRERSNTPRSIVWADERPDSSPAQKNRLTPEPPPHSERRQFSFTSIFGRKKSSDNLPRTPVSPGRGILRGPGSSEYRRAVKAATEEERLGLVKGDPQASKMEHEQDIQEEDEDDDIVNYDEKAIVRSSSPEMFDAALSQALEDVKSQYRPHQVSTSSSMSTSTFPAYEDMHHHYERNGPQPGQFGGYQSIRRVSSPPAPEPLSTTTRHPYSSEVGPYSISEGKKKRLNNSLPPIPDATPTREHPDSEFVHVQMDSNPPPAYSRRGANDEDDDDYFNPSEFGVISAPSSSSSATSPPSASRGYRRSYRAHGHHQATGSSGSSRNRNLNRTGAGQDRRGPRSNSDSSSGGSDVGTRRLVGDGAFI